jgi:hypothetical protein
VHRSFGLSKKSFDFFSFSPNQADDATHQFFSTRFSTLQSFQKKKTRPCQNFYYLKKRQNVTSAASLSDLKWGFLFLSLLPSSSSSGKRKDLRRKTFVFSPTRSKSTLSRIYLFYFTIFYNILSFLHKFTITFYKREHPPLLFAAGFGSSPPCFEI